MNRPRAAGASPHPLYSVAALRALEARAQAALPAGTLMQRAGQAAARLAMEIGSDRPGPVWVLAGPGNNGGDAVVAAQVLRAAGVQVELALLAPPERFGGDAALAWAAASAGGHAAWRDNLDGIAAAALVIDGLYGIGLTDAQRPLPERAAQWIERVNALACPVLALDIPSGLTADHGACCGGSAVRATATLTFLADKPGLHTLDGPDHAGAVHIESLGVDADPGRVRASEGADVATIGALNGPAVFAAALRPRARNSHKGVFGNLAVVGGNTGMVGAALLAGRAALHAGAGRVYVHLLGANAPAWDPVQPELMLRAPPDAAALPAIDVIVAGPGMGEDEAARSALAHCLASGAALVADADGLNLIAADGGLAAALAARTAPAVLTPHPLEAARLLHGTVAAVQADRIGAARGLAQRFGAVVILKGVGSVIATPDGSWWINPTGNPGLATAGTGDVLAGLAGALLGQGWSAGAAATGAAWLHGRAADVLVGRPDHRGPAGPIGMVASDLILPIRAALNQLFVRFAPQP